MNLNFGNVLEITVDWNNAKIVEAWFKKKHLQEMHAYKNNYIWKIEQDPASRKSKMIFGNHDL